MLNKYSILSFLKKMLVSTSILLLFFSIVTVAQAAKVSQEIQFVQKYKEDRYKITSTSEPAGCVKVSGTTPDTIKAEFTEAQPCQYGNQHLNIEIIDQSQPSYTPSVTISLTPTNWNGKSYGTCEITYKKGTRSMYQVTPSEKDVCETPRIIILEGRK